MPKNRYTLIEQSKQTLSQHCLIVLLEQMTVLLEYLVLLPDSVLAVMLGVSL